MEEETGQKVMRERMKSSESEEYYHVCTDGKALDWMFKDREDFINGINRIAICSIESNVTVKAYTLMDNHAHLVMRGKLQQCKDFIIRFKTQTGRWISSKYNIKNHLKHLPTQLIHIKDEEQLLETIAYLDRNSIVAGYCSLPSEYPWSSAKYLFKSSGGGTAGRRILDYSKREIKELLHTWAKLPDHWIVDDEGMICPENFLDIKSIEVLYKSPLRYLYYLSKKLEGKIEMQQGTSTFIPDKELRPIIESISKQFFDKRPIKELDFNSRLLLARKLRYNYAATIKQIARMVHLDVDTLSKFM